MAQPVVFLDRDGVINQNRSDYVKAWSEFEFLPGSLPALRHLAQLGCPIVIISNQSAIGRGLVSRQTVDEINARMVQTIRQEGGRVDLALYCPHRPDENCACRKPQTGLLMQAAQQLDVDLEHSFLVGDAASDIQAAHAVGCQPILVKTGRGLEQSSILLQQNMDGFYVAEDLSDAVNWIIGQVRQENTRNTTQGETG